MIHVIIGAGAAGMTAAKTIRQADPEAYITIISTDEHVHSRCMLHRYLSYERDEKTLCFVDPEFFNSDKVNWVAGKTVKTIDTADHMVVLDDDQKYSYDKLLIATGANSFIPPVGQFREASNVFGLRHLTDAQNIRKSAEKASNILIVGSGLVGLDAAYSFLEQGKHVTVVEMADRILPIQLNEKGGKAYKKLFEDHGCKFILSRKASDTHMNENGEIDYVTLDDGTKIDCELVIVAAGVRPALECIQGTNIEADRFITVSDSMQTNVPDIYAAGDVTGLSGIWPNAMKQGQTAGYNMCGIKTQYIDKYAMKNTMNFYGLTTLSLGRGVEEEGDVVIEREDSHNYRRAILRDGKLDSILLQGKIDYSGIYQYLIKNEIDLSGIKKDIFHLSFADFYSIDERGAYSYNV